MGRRRRRRQFSALTPSEELRAFLDQTNISPKNLRKIEMYARHADAEVRRLAEVILVIAQVAPRRRRRARVIALARPDILVPIVRTLGEGFGEEEFPGDDEQGEGFWDRWREAEMQVRFEKHGIGPCWCGSGRAYWRCCGERDDLYAEVVAAEASERERRLDPGSIPWWHPDSYVSDDLRSAYSLYYADPDHPFAVPPPECRI